MGILLTLYALYSLNCKATCFTNHSACIPSVGIISVRYRLVNFYDEFWQWGARGKKWAANGRMAGENHSYARVSRTERRAAFQAGQKLASAPMKITAASQMRAPVKEKV